jgi:hypothetical protein
MALLFSDRNLPVRLVAAADIAKRALELGKLKSGEKARKQARRKGS